MNIMIVTRLTRGGQGAERYLINLMEGLQRQGHDIVLVTNDPAALGPSHQQLEIVAVKSGSWLATCGPRAKQWQAILECHRPDVVHIVNPMEIGIGITAAARPMGIPVVATIVDFWWLCPKATLMRSDNSLCKGRMPPSACIDCIARTHRFKSLRLIAGAAPLLGRIYLMLLTLLRSGSLNEYRQWLRRDQYISTAVSEMDYLIALSNTSKDLMRSLSPHARMVHIPVGLADHWRPMRHHKKTSTRHPRIRIGFCGTIAEHKGLHVLLEALQLLPNSSGITLAVAGPFGDRRYVHRVRRLSQGLSVDFLGKLDPHDLKDFYDDLDLLVVPSLSPENRPQVIAEAQAIGIPVIASDVPGNAEMFASRSRLFRAGSAEDLARVLSNHLHTGTTREGKEREQQWISVWDMCSNTARIYARAIERHDKGA